MIFYVRDLLNIKDRVRLYAMTHNLIDISDQRNFEMRFLDNKARTKLVLKIGNSKFNITNTNRPRVLRGLKDAINWFYDTSKNDLFTYDQNNQLTFNPKYAKLKRVIHQDVTSITEFIEIIPTVVSDDNYKDFEGVLVNLNMKAATALTIDEFTALANCVEDHSFQDEILLSYMRSMIKPVPALTRLPDPVPPPPPPKVVEEEAKPEPVPMPKPLTFSVENPFKS